MNYVCAQPARTPAAGDAAEREAEHELVKVDGRAAVLLLHLLCRDEGALCVDEREAGLHFLRGAERAAREGVRRWEGERRWESTKQAAAPESPTPNESR